MMRKFWLWRFCLDTLTVMVLNKDFEWSFWHFPPKLPINCNVNIQPCAQWSTWANILAGLALRDSKRSTNEPLGLIGNSQICYIPNVRERSDKVWLFFANVNFASPPPNEPGHVLREQRGDQEVPAILPTLYDVTSRHHEVTQVPSVPSASKRALLTKPRWVHTRSKCVDSPKGSQHSPHCTGCFILSWPRTLAILIDAWGKTKRANWTKRTHTESDAFRLSSLLKKHVFFWMPLETVAEAENGALFMPS